MQPDIFFCGETNTSVQWKHLIYVTVVTHCVFTPAIKPRLIDYLNLLLPPFTHSSRRVCFGGRVDLTVCRRMEDKAIWDVGCSKRRCFTQFSLSWPVCLPLGSCWISSSDSTGWGSKQLSNLRLRRFLSWKVRSVFENVYSCSFSLA